MRILGDIERVKVYTLQELEKKEKLEMVLASEFDIFAITGLDPNDREFHRTCIREVIRKNTSVYNHKCTCPIQKFKQVRYVSAKDLITYLNGKCNLDAFQVGFIMPKNTAIGKDFSELLLLIRQMMISRKESVSITFEFFTVWMGLNISTIILLYMERYIVQSVFGKM
ncbi:uncharacterized protein NEMAJ01_0800 [Nematocida major]|uniref:uncharacterized protein n=1 Tax=Nematocida major TaxID=1912982 RepID=UPI002007E209|nr:uncharacterized protein NEMAJ01_0800 [Nematocida major]KAH9385904.1 hypothetical protein NEMAJ01_0800 [Nematocida major]